jgi:hypothetical protein
MTLPVILGSCEQRREASLPLIENIEGELAQRLPPDYRDFLLESDGIEGFLDEEHYLVLWPVKDLPSLNRGYAVREFAPGLVLLGTDGADVGYGFVERDGRYEYVAVPLVGLGIDNAVLSGATLVALLEQIVGTD